MTHHVSSASFWTTWLKKAWTCWTPREGIEYEIRTGLKGDDLREALADFDGAVCRSGVKITAESLEGNRRLRAIVRAGVGTDNIDKAAATRHGIVVMNTPAGNTLSTAEHTFALMLGLSRNIAAAHQSLREGRWDRKNYMGTQLADKTLGIVGLGRIGQEVARRAVAFGMRVLGYDPFLSPEQAAKLGIDKVENVAATCCPQVDYLTVHTPLTPETKHLIGSREIELLKPGARLINAARGGIYDEAALVEGLQSGKLAGVALDVFETEPCTEQPAVRHARRAVHAAPGSQHRRGADPGGRRSRPPADSLPAPRRDPPRREHGVGRSQDAQGHGWEPGCRLSAGPPAGPVARGAASSCQLQYRGEVASQDTKLLTASFCAGLARTGARRRRQHRQLRNADEGARHSIDRTARHRTG